MNKRIILMVFYLSAIILGILVGTGLKTTEEVDRQSMTDPVPKP